MDFHRALPSLDEPADGSRGYRDERWLSRDERVAYPLGVSFSVPKRSQTAGEHLAGSSLAHDDRSWRVFIEVASLYTS